MMLDGIEIDMNAKFGKTIKLRKLWPRVDNWLD